MIKNSQNSKRICYQRLILSYLSTALESIQSLLHTISNHVIFDALHEHRNGVVQVLVGIRSGPLPSFGGVHGGRHGSGIACIVSFSAVSQQGFEVINVLGSAVRAQESHLNTEATSVTSTVDLTAACIFRICVKLIKCSFGCA